MNGHKYYITFFLNNFIIINIFFQATRTLDQLPLNGRNLYVRIDEGRKKTSGAEGEPPAEEAA
jgi:hypothetical protein